MAYTIVVRRFRVKFTTYWYHILRACFVYEQAKLEARGEANKGSRERLEPKELRSRLFALFAKQNTYLAKELNKELQQSEVRVACVAGMSVYLLRSVLLRCLLLDPCSHFHASNFASCRAVYYCAALLLL